jgi:putative ABC transport system permease protein
MILPLLAYKSLRSRSVTTALTVFSIALSVFLLVGVDRVRQGMQTGFEGTLSHADLLVGARAGSLPLLLYSIFHIGTGANDISYDSYEHFRNHPAVKWTIPFSLGDSFHGYRVVATDDNFYEHYQYRGGRSIQVAQGARAEGIFDAVLGSDVAKALGYRVGQQIILTHGIEGSFLQHKANPYTVVGILAPTSTPVDHAIYITLYGEEAMHLGWQHGAPPLEPVPASQIRKEDLHITQISAFLLATKSRISTLLLQREIDTYKPEPLTAIIPALALEDLWSVLNYADVALSLVSAAVLVVGLLAMLTAIYTALNERRHEIAILRSVGLHRRQIFSLFVLESTFVSAAGVLLGLAALYVVLLFGHGFVEQRFGIPLAVVGLSTRVELYIVVIILAGASLGLIPGIRAYRTALTQGLTSQ